MIGYLLHLYFSADVIMGECGLKYNRCDLIQLRKREMSRKKGLTNEFFP